jgi:RNA polymerase sigma factor (sigma-70 family)
LLIAVWGTTVDHDVQFAIPDEDLAVRFLESPDSYREAFAGRCAELLHGYVRRQIYMGDRGSRSAHKETFAEDVYSLALSKFVPALRQLKCAKALHSWLMAIARSAVVEEITSRKRRTHTPIQFESLDDLISRAAEEARAAYELGNVESAMVTYHTRHWPDPEAAAILNEQLDILRIVYTQHSVESTRGAECSAIIANIYTQEMTLQQIAGVLGRPKSTVHDIVRDNMNAYREMYMRAANPKPAPCKVSAL